ncbi:MULTISPECIES: sigma-54-dependent Fis family transcriptional regulator [Anaeromyxobacter]|uniref:sigma-54 interaction domain-containing protein n=1 Tax=Anaeromyxobacter TaxID=161492 RepID=UPI001F5A9AB4|nr:MULTISPECIES: sigma-54 dependent transcriptional regulator [unclassified Anaeromyxobacter]
MGPPAHPHEAAFQAVTAAFASLGRVCLALDVEYRMRHISPLLDDLLGAGAAEHYRGRPIVELLGCELFGVDGPFRAALAASERREGWRAWLPDGAGGRRPTSVTVAPLRNLGGACDREAVYLIVLRPADPEVGEPCGPARSTSLVVGSPAMERVQRLVESLDHSDVSVLIGGESGVGKGVVAQEIHARSRRRERPFVAVNCAALPDALLESELFGHVRGAFTGALRDRTGRFELADGGTLFLDEVGDLPLHVQAKLLRVIQERSFERVGDSRTITVNVRIIAATHRDLRREVEARRFREDLLYRLRVFPIEIPSLRQRREDVAPLARHLLARSAARTGRELRLSPEALRQLEGYRWPGNVRELENALEYAATVATGQTIQPEDLPSEVLAVAEPARSAHDATVEREGVRGSSRRRDPPAREELLAALQENRWHIADTSRALSVSRSTLWRWMRERRVTRAS